MGVLINAMAPRKQTGMPSITQKASLISRNRASTMKTSRAPMPRFFTIIPSLLLEVESDIRPRLQADAAGQLVAFLLNILPRGPGGIDNVLLAHGKNVDAKGVLSVEQW